DHIFDFEGEKCTDLARDLGLPATTTAHGARLPHKTDLSPLAGKVIILVLDAGPAGEAYGTKLLTLLARLTPRPTVKVVRRPGLADGADIEQWLDRFADPQEALAELRRLVEAAPEEDLVVATRATAEPVAAADRGPADPGFVGFTRDAGGGGRRRPQGLRASV